MCSGVVSGYDCGKHKIENSWQTRRVWSYCEAYARSGLGAECPNKEKDNDDDIIQATTTKCPECPAPVAAPEPQPETEEGKEGKK